MFGFLLIIFLLGIFIIGIDLGKTDYGEIKVYSNSTECQNLSLDDTAYCLRDYVRTFYRYEVRNDNEKPLEDLMENGGDCYDWSMLYIKLFKELGFKADYFQRNGITDNKTRIAPAHRWMVAWDGKRRCEIDHLEVKSCRNI